MSSSAYNALPARSLTRVRQIVRGPTSRMRRTTRTTRNSRRTLSCGERQAGQEVRPPEMPEEVGTASRRRRQPIREVREEDAAEQDVHDPEHRVQRLVVDDGDHEDEVDDRQDRQHADEDLVARALQLAPRRPRHARILARATCAAPAATAHRPNRLRPRLTRPAPLTPRLAPHHDDETDRGHRDHGRAEHGQRRQRAAADHDGGEGGADRDAEVEHDGDQGPGERAAARAGQPQDHRLRERRERTRGHAPQHEHPDADHRMHRHHAETGDADAGADGAHHEGPIGALAEPAGERHARRRREAEHQQQGADAAGNLARRRLDQPGDVGVRPVVADEQQRDEAHDGHHRQDAAWRARHGSRARHPRHPGHPRHPSTPRPGSRHPDRGIRPASGCGGRTTTVRTSTAATRAATARPQNAARHPAPCATRLAIGVPMTVPSVAPPSTTATALARSRSATRSAE